MRNEHKLNVIVDFIDNSRYYGYSVSIHDSKNREYVDGELLDQAKIKYLSDNYDTYEEALEQGLTEGLKILIGKNK